MELKIKTQISIDFSHMLLTAGCVLTFLLTIILFFHAITFHRISKTKIYFRKDVSESCTLNTNGQKSHVSFKNSM